MFKRFLIWSSGGPPVPWSGTICVILKEGIMGNIHVCNCVISQLCYDFTKELYENDKLMPGLAHP